MAVLLAAPSATAAACRRRWTGLAFLLALGCGWLLASAAPALPSAMLFRQPALSPRTSHSVVTHLPQSTLPVGFKPQQLALTGTEFRGAGSSGATSHIQIEAFTATPSVGLGLAACAAWTASALLPRRARPRRGPLAALADSAVSGEDAIPSTVPIAGPVPEGLSAPAPYRWKGAALRPLAITLAVGLFVSLIPCPAALTPKAWRLLAIFLSTVTGIITGPLPLGAVALLSLGVSLLTKTLTFPEAFGAMGSEIPWLTTLAFFFARGFINTGLGNRLAWFFVSHFGRSTLGLTYSLVFSEALLAPAIPSVAARAGGVILPLVKALSEACDSRPGDGTERRLGAYLAVTCFQASCVSSAMFLTGMAANPLAAKLALGATGKAITWGVWAMAALVPGLVSLLLVPLVVYTLFPPAIKASPQAPAQAKRRLAELGPVTVDERIMAAALLGTVLLWVFGDRWGISAVPAALAGLGVLLGAGVLSWADCLKETAAWDTLTWFGALISMATALNSMGVIRWFVGSVTAVISGLPAATAIAVLGTTYFYSHYFFASSTAHIGAMYSAFLAIIVSLGGPPLISALLLAFMSNLMGGLTHYGFGSAPSYYGLGYVSLGRWWALGAACSAVNLAVWAGLGPLWWRLLGLL